MRGSHKRDRRPPSCSWNCGTRAAIRRRRAILMAFNTPFRFIRTPAPRSLCRLHAMTARPPPRPRVRSFWPRQSDLLSFLSLFCTAVFCTAVHVVRAAPSWCSSCAALVDPVLAMSETLAALDWNVYCDDYRFSPVPLPWTTSTRRPPVLDWHSISLPAGREGGACGWMPEVSGAGAARSGPPLRRRRPGQVGGAVGDISRLAPPAQTGGRNAGSPCPGRGNRQERIDRKVSSSAFERANAHLRRARTPMASGSASRLLEAGRRRRQPRPSPWS